MKIILPQFTDKLLVRNLIKGLFQISVNAVYLPNGEALDKDTIYFYLKDFCNKMHDFISNCTKNCLAAGQ